MSLQPPESVRAWLTAPVAIFGGGISGVGVCAILAELGANSVIYDTKGALFAFGAAKSHRLVVYSPGFPPEHPWLEEARAAGCACLSELDFASLFWQGSIVAVTGTNGKTTLTEFLTHALRAAGRNAYATGNIGHSFSELVAQSGGGAREDIAVCEVSSFQAEALQHFRADATLWTNFAEDHLERHAGLENYFAAKWNLIERTGGRLRPREETALTSSSHEPGRAVFVGSSVQRFAEKFDHPLPAGAAIATEHQPGDTRLAGTVFQDYPQRENFLLAAAWWKFAGMPKNQLYLAAQDFQLGRHRLTRVGERDGVVYWNDSKATNFHAVEAALAGFSTPVVLIAGGKAKGGDLAGFVHRIAPAVKHAVLIGDTAEELAFHCSAFRLAHTRCPTLADAVDRAAELASAGDNILLSPGFASFDQFKGYADRGEQFEKLVNGLEPASHPDIRVSRKF